MAQWESGIQGRCTWEGSAHRVIRSNLRIGTDPLNPTSPLKLRWTEQYVPVMTGCILTVDPLGSQLHGQMSRKHSVDSTLTSSSMTFLLTVPLPR